MSGTTLASIIVFITYLKPFVLHKKMVWLINLCLYGIMYCTQSTHVSIYLLRQSDVPVFATHFGFFQAHMHQLFKDK